MTVKPAHLLVLLLAAAALPAVAQNVAVVNGKPVPTARVDSVLKDIEARGQKDSPELREQIKGKLVELEVLSQEADKQGLGNSPEVKEKLALFREQMLANALVQDHAKKIVVKDSDVVAEYNKIKAAAENREEYHAYHILVEKEQDAKDIIAKLKGGAKFEDIAKEKSTDPGSAQNGGDLGWADPSGYVKEFSEAMTHLQKGQFTDTPVKSQFGYHIIRLDDKRPAQVPSLEDVKPRLTEMLKQKQMEEYLASLQAKATIADGSTPVAAEKKAKK